MCNSSKKFQELVKQMDALQENEKGQLKGGFQTVTQVQLPLQSAFNGLGCNCGTTSVKN